MKAALLLIDVQNDFLERRGLYPDAAPLIARVESLLSGFRQRRLPVFHIQTLVQADGSDRMPHWKSHDHWACVEGTRGACPPASLAPVDDERVIRKRFFSGFESGELREALESQGIDTVVIAGLFTHGCVRATALDAYALGHTVQVAEDCIASPEPAHAQISERWMDQRGMRFVNSSVLLADLGLAPPPDAGRSRHYNPSRTSELLAETDYAGPDAVDAAVRTASRAQAKWAAVPPSRRIDFLGAWTSILEADRDRLADLMALEIGKPRTDASEEIERAIGHIGATIRLLTSTGDRATPYFRVNDRPVGTVAIITPWNNPLAIPVGKIAPALGFGNGVVWKPALPASLVTQAIMEHLNRLGLPPGLVEVVRGDGATAQGIIKHPNIAAVSFTGSNGAGNQVAALCGLLRKPLQAELGGNNAAVVLADADLALAARSIAASAFGFGGQRCTAARRVIVEARIRDAFLELLMAEVKGLVVGDPRDPATQVGPLISTEHLQRVTGIVEQALANHHGRLLCGGTIPLGLAHGNWFLPTLIDGVAAGAPIVQEETFGPVAVVQVADDFEHAMALCNGVQQGLVASLFSSDLMLQERFVEAAQAGILRINPKSFPVHSDAPFLGWKSSGIGPAEHGRWDREFYTRPQAVYGRDAGLHEGSAEPHTLP